jgi:hypothetical protein
MGQRRQTIIIGGVKHLPCNKCRKVRPIGAFNLCRGYPLSWCKACQAIYTRERKRTVRGWSPEKADASGAYLETLERFQAWAAKRDRPWKAELVEVLTARMKSE